MLRALEILIVLMFLGWIIAVVAFKVTVFIIHVLLVLAIIGLVVRLVSGRSA